MTTGNLKDNFMRLTRDTQLKTFFATGDITADDIRAERENRPALYLKKDDWWPPQGDIPSEVDRRLRAFQKAIEPLFLGKPGSHNLLPFQRKFIRELRRNDDIVICNADKGLGTCAVKYSTYVEDGLIHLQDEKVYEQLSREEADAAAIHTRSLIDDWCREFRKNGVTRNDMTWIRHHVTKNMEPFGFFYLMYKIHKAKNKDGRWPTCPVCSDCGSLLHSLGKWITTMLLPIAQEQDSYFENSLALKELIEDMFVPNNSELFSCDAKSMYTNIPTDPALEVISSFLRAKYPFIAEPLISALTIVMKNNIIQFGDTYWKQISGTAMGISPAPPWAILFFALHEKVFTVKWKEQLPFWRRFIDDGLGLWLRHPDPTTNNTLWNEFKHDVNDYHGLEWVFTHPSQTVDFMDLTISIANNKFTTTLFEKELNLYVYIPPNSAHPPGVVTGLVFGMILRIWKLCSRANDAKRRIKTFFRRLLRRGYTKTFLIPLFAKATENAKRHFRRTPAEFKSAEDAKLVRNHRRVFFHLPYHPNDTKSSVIQRHWRDNVMFPKGKTAFNQVRNHEDEKIPIDQLTIAYHRAPNLGNMFSVRKLHKRRGPSVSSFL